MDWAGEVVLAGVEHFIGLDLGTTGARAVVFDASARDLGEASREYPLYTPRPGWAEQDADEVADTALACVRRAVRRAGLSRGARAAIGVSGTFHSVMPIDSAGRPLGRALTWADTRASADAAWIKRQTDPAALYGRTGCPVHPMYLPAKLRWLRRENGAAPAYRSIKEYVLYRLTGRWACDLSVASGTGMLDMGRRSWDDEALALAGVQSRQLGPLVETTEVVGGMAADAARACRLAVGSPVVAGAGDGVLSSLGAGTIGPGQATATIGTSGAVRLVTDAPRVDDQGRTWCYYLAQGRWVAGAAINNGGLAFRWAGEHLLRAGARSYERLLAWAAEVEPGAEGVLCLPFLAGERAPYWNADARGVVVGLSLSHDHRHVARAVLEGICYRMRSIATAVDEVAGPIQETRATGGYTRSRLWLQMLADVLGRGLQVPSVQEASALGAAELAMLGVGAIRDLEDTRGFVSVGPAIEPRVDLTARYGDVYEVWMRTYRALTPVFGEIRALQTE